MNKKDILDYVDKSSSTLKEVFIKIINTPKFHQTEIEVTKEYLSKIDKSIVKNELAFIKNIDINTFEEKMLKREKEYESSFLHFVLKPISYYFFLPALAKELGLNASLLKKWEREKDPKLNEVGYAATFAGLYLILEKS